MLERTLNEVLRGSGEFAAIWGKNQPKQPAPEVATIHSFAGRGEKDLFDEVADVRVVVDFSRPTARIEVIWEINIHVAMTRVCVTITFNGVPVGAQIAGGEDPLYVARRVVRMASEDIGLADPRGAEIALNATQTYERLGSPEGELALAQALIYLACAPKSNAGYMAYNQARAFVREDGSREVPVHLRNAPTKLMKELGYGREYRYAHDEPEAYAAGETYFPEDIASPPRFYAPTPRGLEAKIGEKLNHLAELDRRAREAKERCPVVQSIPIQV